MFKTKAQNREGTLKKKIAKLKLEYDFSSLVLWKKKALTHSLKLHELPGVIKDKIGFR